jgi:hypothetical protein
MVFQGGYLILLMVLSAAKTDTKTSSGHNKFPDLFIFGTATASFQVEGGWNADGKIQYPYTISPW